MPFEKDPNDIGALWVKNGPKGQYMTGTIGGVKVVVFSNGRKTSDKQPDWRVLKSIPREDAAPRTSREPGDDDIQF